MLRVVVHPAPVTDRGGARVVLEEVPTTFPTLRQVWVDRGDQGTLLGWAQQTLGVTLTVVKRTVAWLGHHCRLSNDDEQLPSTEEAWSSTTMTLLVAVGWPNDLFKHPLDEVQLFSALNRLIATVNVELAIEALQMGPNRAR
jgi:hypothetical protein